MSGAAPLRILALEGGPEVASLLRPDGVACSYRSARDAESLLAAAPEADLVVLPESPGAADLARQARGAAPDALLVLLRARGLGVPRDPRCYDDILVRTRARDAAHRLGDLVRIGRLRRRFRSSGLTTDEARKTLAELRLQGTLVDEGGLAPPGRVRLASLHDMHRMERHQSSICELMGTAFATLRYDDAPRPLRDDSGRDLTATGTLAPFCAYLKGAGERAGRDRCLESDWAVAERAFTTLRPAEHTCAGGVGLYAVPVVLRFGSIRAPLAVLVVATGPLPGERAIESAARSYGVDPEILRQMAGESRFWVLHPDKVGCLEETMRHLASAISLEVSHAYATAYQAVAGLLRQTDLRCSEEQLAQKARELEEANLRLEQKHREIHDFTHSVTHDLKKPLGAMRTMLSMLQRGYLGEMPEKQLRAVDTAHEAADYMIRLVQDLLESSKVDAGAAALDLEPLDPDPILARTIQRLRYQIEEKGVDLRVEPLPRVVADEDGLEKIFMNLLGNAVSYIGDGAEKRVVVRAERRGDRVRIEVADTGIGIPEDSRDRIFEKFRRGSNVVDTSGTGLGLAIVKGLVEAHGGHVEVETELGRGTKFRFDLQAARPEEIDLHPSSDPGRYEDVAPAVATTTGAVGGTRGEA